MAIGGRDVAVSAITPTVTPWAYALRIASPRALEAERVLAAVRATAAIGRM
jgi:hypothetical protein